MIRGLYTAASGMLSSMRRMEFVTNNLANAQTVGFKQDRTALSTFDEVMILQNGSVLPPGTHELGELGMAAISEEPIIDFTQGVLQETGRNLDFAIEGPAFFSVQTPDGVRYTRDGGFTKDATGRLTTPDGHLVLGVDGNPITIPAGRLEVEPNGTMRVEGQEVGRLAMVEFSLEQPLKKVGDNQFVARNDGDQPTPSAGSAVHQNFVEVSNVDMAGAQTMMMELQRAYEANQKLIQYQDEMVGRAVNEIAKPA
ncbi:MAG: flagellar basal-body rod protein FlgF [Chloroflexota bacterium]